MKKKPTYVDHLGRTEPPDSILGGRAYYAGNLPRGRVVIANRKRLKITGHGPGHVAVTTRAKKEKVTIGTAEVVERRPARTFTISPGSVVRLAGSDR